MEAPTEPSNKAKKGHISFHNNKVLTVFSYSVSPQINGLAGY
jgi:hypothetical protein